MRQTSRILYSVGWRTGWKSQMERVKLSLGKDRSIVHHIIDTCPDGWTIEVKPRSRTLEQNALYWTTVHSIAEEVTVDGQKYTPMVWHKYFKQRFLPWNIVELPYGHIAESEPTTTELTKQEFSEFVEQVIQFYSEHKETT
jgi:hypothetical protein